jgi:hypothetical protein
VIALPPVEAGTGFGGSEKQKLIETVQPIEQVEIE